MRVKSAVDWWLALLIWGAVLLMVVTTVTAPPEERLLAIAIGIPVILFVVWIYFGTYYELRETYLYSRSGPFSEKIPYENIKSVRLCISILASMALSIKRIEIRQHGKGYVLCTTYISPLNREEFLRELTSRCPNLD